jgi:hypothetical protein
MECQGGARLTEKTEELGEKPAPVPLSSPQIQHVLTRARTRASAVRSRRLTARARIRHAWILDGEKEKFMQKFYGKKLLRKGTLGRSKIDVKIIFCWTKGKGIVSRVQIATTLLQSPFADIRQQR